MKSICEGFFFVLAPECRDTVPAASVVRRVQRSTNSLQLEVKLGLRMQAVFEGLKLLSVHFQMRLLFHLPG